ncbi:hypothetical protein [Aureibacter tunicatorum]|uniref:Uncharacterized protein n=1 Tax=Aureibacter tunicatorum TaxID=866807 RepID=A0AAE3XRD8_9BACT|nr:hypothetical protein [Aureibacter tunicatorum]MDR6240049.1 hypothetical protein [Aureibacter tunicatorum]BDD04521.1 hypothetical protein AUTU_20040 [Aureibacter tunicatorum]
MQEQKQKQEELNLKKDEPKGNSQSKLSLQDYKNYALITGLTYYGGNQFKKRMENVKSPYPIYRSPLDIIMKQNYFKKAPSGIKMVALSAFLSSYGISKLNKNGHFDVIKDLAKYTKKGTAQYDPKDHQYSENI